LPPPRRRLVEWYMLAAHRWYSLGEQGWHILGAHCRYILGENTWHNSGEQTWYVLTRKMTWSFDRFLVVPQYGPYPHHGLGKEVRRIFHKLRSITNENFNEQFKGIFDGHGQVPTKGLINTQRFVLGAIFVYQFALLYRFEHGLDLRVGLKAFLKGA